MMEVSEKVATLPEKAKLADKARTHLYRGQCNCPYWHGVFGGMYLPHLRSSVYRELIKADKLADEILESRPVSQQIQDFDFDGEEEIRLANAHLALYLHPRRGGHLYEFDLRDIDFNAADTFSRRFEAYHEKVARAHVAGGDVPQAASIHDLVLAKEPGLAELLKYDAYMRESLVDHLSLAPLTPQDMLSGNPPSDPGFRQGPYDARAANTKHTGGDARATSRRSPAAEKDKPAAVDLVRRAAWNGADLSVSKRILLRSKAAFEVEYVIEHHGGADVDGFFGVEMNYSLLAGEAHDRYYYHDHTDNAGKLATVADFGMLSCVGLKDHWLNVALTLRPSIPARVVASPVKTVSQSEGGFEAVYQSSSVVLQWPLKLHAPQSAAGKAGGSGNVFKVTLQQETGRARE
jgi:alpha-amylase